MKKLITINSVLALILISVFVLGYYYIYYPADFDIIRYIRDAEWKTFALIIVVLMFVAVALSFLPVKNFSQKQKVAIFFASLQGLVLLWFTFEMVDTYKQNKIELDNLIAEYKEKANVDIKKGFIEIEYAGGLELPTLQQQKMHAEEDSIRKLYGFSYRNSGCTVSAALQTAQEEYERLTKPFLDNRNGPGWEKRMEIQMRQVRDKYR